MREKFAYAFLLATFFISGVLLGHYKPELFATPLSYLKTALSDDKNSFYEESITRLNQKFKKGSCASNNQGYSFFVAGHVYGTPGTSYEGFYKPFKNNMVLKNCSDMPLGFLLGDAVVEASNYEFNILQDEIKSLGNDTKVHISPGNHEVGTGPYNAKRDLYIKNFGKTFKFFRYESDLFILLDANSHYWNILDNQLQMLKDLSLKKAEYRNVFIFSHQVIWADSNNKRFSRLITNSKEGKAEKLNFWNDVFPLIKDLGKNVFFFSGDVGAFDNDSEFFYDNISNVDFFATGMGGGKRDNFLILHVNQGNVEIELIEF